MKTIALYDAYYFLNNCAGLLLEGRLVEPILSEIEDDYENEFLVLQWEQVYEGVPLTVEVAFKEKDNQTVGLDGAVLTLINIEGEEEDITLLREWHPLIK